MKEKSLAIWILTGIVLVSSIAWGLNSLSKVYSVWAEAKDGEAELARASYNRKIKILEAEAFEESAKHFARAEIIKAEGLAESNRIIGSSLKENESYLKYLWITSLQTNNKEIVYIPTEANLPILEAGKR